MKGTEAVKREQVFFEDVEVGSEIPPLTRGPYTAIRITMFIAAMFTDFFPSHFDGLWAKKMGRPDTYVHSNQVIALLGQLLTDWIGLNGTLKKFASQVRGDTYQGDTLTVGGTVTKKYTKEGENYLECELWGNKQDGTMVVKGSATVALPSRG